MIAGEARRDRGYLPALRYPALTPWFDSIARILFRERALKARLVERIALRPGWLALDIGCGTGTLAVLLKQSEPGAVIVGIDGDPTVLERARGKAAAANLEITFDVGMAQALPYPNDTFDVVTSTLMLHHLRHPDKVAAIREAFRVLRAGGAYYVIEFTRPRGRLMLALAKVSELLEETEDGVLGRLPGMFRDAGFSTVEEGETFVTPLGPVALFRCFKPS